MSFNGSGLFQINTSGQPVVAGTVISDSVFNALTADLATGLSTAICKDGQTTVTANIPMSGYKITGLGIGTSSTDAARVDNVNALNMVEGRLTVESGVPVSTTDQTAKETLYFAPYKGNRIALHDGTNWKMHTFTQMSIDVPDVTGVHDVFIYDNSGTPTLEVVQWTNDTTRAVGLMILDGVLVKTYVPPAVPHRYLGTFYSTTAGNGQIEDSAQNRYLWNYYNRVKRPLASYYTSGGWNYTLTTVRQANGSTANQVNFVVGWAEDVIDVRLATNASNTSAGVYVLVGIGLDSTTTMASLGTAEATPAANYRIQLSSFYSAIVGVGKHYLAWLEYSDATGTTSWNGGAYAGQLGLQGEIFG